MQIQRYRLRERHPSTHTHTHITLFVLSLLPASPFKGAQPLPPCPSVIWEPHVASAGTRACVSLLRERAPDCIFTFKDVFLFSISFVSQYGLNLKPPVPSVLICSPSHLPGTGGELLGLPLPRDSVLLRDAQGII